MVFGGTKGSSVTFIDEHGVSHGIPEEFGDDAPFIPGRISVKVSYKAGKVCVGKIVSWFFDVEFDKFVVKRTDGCQFFPKRFQMFKTLPLIEVKALMNLKLNFRPLKLSPERLNDTELVEWKVPLYLKTVREELKSGVFKLIRPQKGKRHKVSMAKSKKRYSRSSTSQ
jgi:hypothetical protein